MNHFFRFKKYTEYYWRAKTKYYLHSPFVFQLYLHVLEGSDEPAWEAVENLRKRLLMESTTIDVEDMGAGTSSMRSVAGIAAKAAIQPKYAQLLYRLVKYFQPQSILELGTSLGISSAYMAIANSGAKIRSLEGSTAIAELAERNHATLGITNIEIIKGNFDDTLSSVLSKTSSLDLVFFDGNHRKDATLRYFNECLPYAGENTIFVFDDICWSPEMYEAWQAIQQHPAVTLSIDVFQFGICFFKKGKVKEDFVLRY